ncbi:MAG: hypothetical protein H6773_04605 [Pseudomonadales bacterium]|nr:hypothetical protein [Pseudomonadales bacterium]
MHERRTPTPLEVKLETSLEDDGKVSLQLSAEDLATVVQLLSQQLLEQNGASKISFTTVSVDIRDQSAKILVIVSIARPVSATFSISYSLINSNVKPGSLLVRDLKIGIQASRLAKLSLKALNVEKQIKETLENLNEVLIQHPPPIVVEKGLIFSDIQLLLENSILTVQLESRPKS